MYFCEQFLSFDALLLIAVQLGDLKSTRCGYEVMLT